jgi:cell division protein ZapA
MSEKQPVRLSIFNQTYSLLVAGDPADMERAANEVDELMTTIARSGNVDSTRIAVLACLHLQTRLDAIEHELSNLKSQVDDKTRRFASMLDELIDAAAPER